MSRRLFSSSLPRNIFNIARQLRMLTSPHPHQPSPDPEALTVSPLSLPDVRAPAQYLIDMGLRPALARHISSVYMDFFSRYRQVVESHFRRVIQGGCQCPEYYRNTFVVQFKGAIQVLESRIMSTAWVWLCQAGISPVPICSQRIDVRVDALTKAQILSRLGLMNEVDQRASIIELPEEEGKSERDPYIATLAVTRPSPAKTTTSSIRDPFSQYMSSTCFPVCYPPPGEPDSSPRKPLTSRYFLTTPATNEKPYTNGSIDMSSLVKSFGRISVTTSAQEDRKYVWGPKSKKSEPLTPLLSPVVAGVSDSHQKVHLPITKTTSRTKSIAAPRKRRIAALPTRHTKATAVSISDPLSPPAANAPVSTPASSNAMSHTPTSQVTRVPIADETPIDYITSSSSSATVQFRPPPPARYVAPKSVSERRKRLLPRRVASQSQIPQSQTRPSTPLSPSGPRIPSSSVSRTPSLVSDTSSYADPHSSSDEFDTPPSTPPSSSHGLTTCNTLATNRILKSNSAGRFGLPILSSVDYANARMGKGIYIDFTDGDTVGEQQLNFTFRA